MKPMKAKAKLEKERKGLHQPVKNENGNRETKETRRPPTTHSFLKENLYKPKQMRRQKEDCWYVG